MLGGGEGPKQGKHLSPTALARVRGGMRRLAGDLHSSAAGSHPRRVHGANSVPAYVAALGGQLCAAHVPADDTLHSK